MCIHIHVDGSGDGPNKRIRRVVNVPVGSNPGFDFIGLLLGPGGATHQRMQAETGAQLR